MVRSVPNLCVQQYHSGHSPLWKREGNWALTNSRKDLCNCYYFLGTGKKLADTAGASPGTILETTAGHFFGSGYLLVSKVENWLPRTAFLMVHLQRTDNTAFILDLNHSFQTEA